jgi:hypothetical protein
MVKFSHKGNFNNLEKFLNSAKKPNIKAVLEKYGQEGVRALAAATPVDTGKTASSWGYEINIGKDSFSIMWTNSNIVDGVPVAIVLQYGHAAKNGGFVRGRDYINPALKPIFDKLAQDAWREVNGR